MPTAASIRAGVPRRGAVARRLHRLAWGVAVASVMLLVGSPSSSAATGRERRAVPPDRERVTRFLAPLVAPVAGLAMTAEAMLGGYVRQGEWAAVRVRLENDGATLAGELRIASGAPETSTYGIPVQLPPGARQEHILYGRPWILRSSFRVELVSGGVVVGSIDVSTRRPSDSDASGIFIVAERPERLIDGLRHSVAPGSGGSPVIAIGPQDLPPRVEAWATVDRLVWQDVQFGDLNVDQVEALRTWVGLGGSLTILGGSTGATTLGSIPNELLPYRPERVVDVALTDLAGLLGELPPGATSVPAVAGDLVRGTALAASGPHTIAARLTYGLGSVTIIGIDPSTPWLAGTPAAAALWARLETPAASRVAPRAITDDRFVQRALSALPSVSAPPMDLLLLLFAGYVVLLGPANYLVLRRLDRREWAWFSVPALVLAFTVATFVLGIALKGTSVVVNELAIVRGAAGADRGVADVAVGVYTPTRASLDIRIDHGAFISDAIVNRPRRGDPAEAPLQVVFGDPASLMGLDIGHAGVRAFRAQAAVAAPRVDAQLQLVDGSLRGTVTNVSDVALEHVWIVYGRAAHALGDMAPGAVGMIDLGPADRIASSTALTNRLTGRTRTNGSANALTLMARAAIVRSLIRSWNWADERPVGDQSESGAVILAWRSGGPLSVDTDSARDLVGETLYVLSARVGAIGSVTYAGPALARSIVDVDAFEALDEQSGMYLHRGSMTVDYHPAGFEGVFEATGLTVRFAQDRAASPDGGILAPLPASEQPDQDDPVGSGPPATSGGTTGLPRIQLFDRPTARWVEFQPTIRSRTYRIADAARYVNAWGSLLVRFVDRGLAEAQEFVFSPAIEGVAR